MRTWKAILLGLGAGAIAATCFLWPAFWSKSEFLLTLQEKWPQLLEISLVAYGFVIVVICTAHILHSNHRYRRLSWLAIYTFELAKAQYWTALLLLLAVDLSGLSLEVNWPLIPIMPMRPGSTSARVSR